MSSSKTPIRQDEKDYLDHFIETKYDDRKNVLKTEMQDTIDKEAEDNFEAFKDKLKISKMHNEVKTLYEDHKKFANEMDSILLEKKGKLDNAIKSNNFFLSIKITFLSFANCFADDMNLLLVTTIANLASYFFNESSARWTDVKVNSDSERLAWTAIL